MAKYICNKYFKIFNQDIDCYKTVASIAERGQLFKLSAKYKFICCCIKVDGGIIPKTNKNKRCDYLFIIEQNDKNFYLFVELKGGGVSAEGCIKQLSNTIEYFKKNFELPLYKDKVLGIIIGGDSTDGMRRKKEDFLKKYNGKLIHKSGRKQIYEYQ